MSSDSSPSIFTKCAKKRAKKHTRQKSANATKKGHKRPKLPADGLKVSSKKICRGRMTVGNQGGLFLKGLRSQFTERLPLNDENSARKDEDLCRLIDFGLEHPNAISSPLVECTEISKGKNPTRCNAGNFRLSHHADGHRTISRKKQHAVLETLGMDTSYVGERPRKPRLSVQKTTLNQDNCQKPRTRHKSHEQESIYEEQDGSPSRKRSRSNQQEIMHQSVENVQTSRNHHSEHVNFPERGRSGFTCVENDREAPPQPPQVFRHLESPHLSQNINVRFHDHKTISSVEEARPQQFSRMRWNLSPNSPSKVTPVFAPRQGTSFERAPRRVAYPCNENLREDSRKCKQVTRDQIRQLQETPRVPRDDWDRGNIQEEFLLRRCSDNLRERYQESSSEPFRYGSEPLEDTRRHTEPQTREPLRVKNTRRFEPRYAGVKENCVKKSPLVKSVNLPNRESIGQKRIHNSYCHRKDGPKVCLSDSSPEAHTLDPRENSRNNRIYLEEKGSRKHFVYEKTAERARRIEDSSFSSPEVLRHGRSHGEEYINYGNEGLREVREVREMRVGWGAHPPPDKARYRTLHGPTARSTTHAHILTQVVAESPDERCRSISPQVELPGRYQQSCSSSSSSWIVSPRVPHHPAPSNHPPTVPAARKSINRSRHTQNATFCPKSHSTPAVGAGGPGPGMVVCDDTGSSNLQDRYIHFQEKIDRILTHITTVLRPANSVDVDERQQLCGYYYKKLRLLEGSHTSSDGPYHQSSLSHGETKKHYPRDTRHRVEETRARLQAEIAATPMLVPDFVHMPALRNYQTKVPVFRYGLDQVPHPGRRSQNINYF